MWSCLHGRDASSHEIWCGYVYPIRSYLYFSEIKDGGRRHLGFVWMSHGTTHKASFVARTSCKKFCYDRLGSFQVIRIWIFSRSGLKVLFTAPKFLFWGILPIKFRGTSFWPPTSLSGTTGFEPSLIEIWRTVRPVDLAKKKKTVANWLFVQTTHVAVSKSKFACRVVSGV